MIDDSHLQCLCFPTQLFSAEFDCESEAACVCCYRLKSCTDARLTNYYVVGKAGTLSGFKSKVLVKFSSCYSWQYLTARGYFSYSCANDSLGFYCDSVATFYGEASCLGTYYLVYSARDYNCLDKMSCAHSLIILKPNNNTNKDIVLEMQGGFVFYNGTLYSNGRNMDMCLEDGFSGYDGNVYCDDCDSCNISFFDNGCCNLNVYCIDNGSCISTNCDSSVISGYQYGTSNVYYTNTTSGSINDNNNQVFEDSDALDNIVLNDYHGNPEELINFSMWSFILESYSFYFNMIEDVSSGRLNDELCRLSSVQCDDYGKCSGLSFEIIKNGSICCRCATGCKDGNVICDGFQHCQRHTITAQEIYMLVVLKLLPLQMVF